MSLFVELKRRNVFRVGAGYVIVCWLIVQVTSVLSSPLSLPEWFEPMLGRLEEACADVGRDPRTLERSIGVFVEATDERSAEETGLGVPIYGPPAEIAETITRFEEIGATRIEVVLWPGTEDSLNAIEPAVELLKR